jgi:hypothetical protein
MIAHNGKENNENKKSCGKYKNEIEIMMGSAGDEDTFRA